jgi:hypothetical protein
LPELRTIRRLLEERDVWRELQVASIAGPKTGAIRRCAFSTASFVAMNALPLHERLLPRFAWLLRNTGGLPNLAAARLLLPSSSWLADFKPLDHSKAEALFIRLQQWVGMEDWPCTLAAQEPDPDPHVSGIVSVVDAPVGPAGSLMLPTDCSSHAHVTYNPELLSEPQALIATLGHELAHYLTSTFPEPPPGGWPNWETAVEVGVTYLGLGVFACNAATSSRIVRLPDGVRVERREVGHLRPDEQVWSLALFCVLRGQGEEHAAEGELVRPLRGEFRRAIALLTGQRDKLHADLFVTVMPRPSVR